MKIFYTYENKKALIMSAFSICLCSHFPTQKFLKIVPSTSSVVTSPPVISAKWWRHSRKSCATKSPESPDCKPCRTRRTSSSAAESAA